MTREICNLCPEKYCVETQTRNCRVRVELENQGMPGRNKIVDTSRVLIEDCPIKQAKEEQEIDDMNDIRNY